MSAKVEFERFFDLITKLEAFTDASKQIVVSTLFKSGNLKPVMAAT